MFSVRDFRPGVWPSLSVCVTPCSLAYLLATRHSSDLDLRKNLRHRLCLSLHTLRLRGQTPPPLGGVKTSSSISIRLPGDRRRVPFGCRMVEISAASLNTESSIAGGCSTPVCRRRAPCLGSVGSSQSSRYVFSDRSLWISTFCISALS